MFRNYFKTAWRNLKRHKLFSFINIFGLALSLLVCLLVITQVNEDLSYDRFHPYPKRTYRVLSDITETKGNKQYELASTPLPLSNALAKQKDIIQYSVDVYPALKGNAIFEGKKLSINAAFASPDFFSVFGFKFSSGTEQSALATANSIVLSDATAKKFFGNTEPLGKTLDCGKFGLFQVTGVMAVPAGKSHLDFDAYASSLALDALEKEKALPALHDNWNSLNYGYTYVVAKEGVKEKALNNFLHQAAQQPQLKSAEGSVNFVSQRLSKITPYYENISNEIARGAVWSKVLTVVGIGLIILLAACFNYTNLTIARALTRAKEVGIRKISGATRWQVFFQYIVESFVIAFVALALACAFLPVVQPGYHFSAKIILIACIFTCITAFAAGAFPAWILSAFKPVSVLKNISTQKLFGNISLQKGLMIFQFSLSILVIIFLSVYYQQFHYLQNINTGFASANIITLPATANDEFFLNEVQRINGVEDVCRMSDDFGMRGTGSLPVYLNKPVNQQGVLADYYFADAGAVPLHQLKLIAGTNFNDAENNGNEKYVLINQKAVKVFGFKEPSTAINKTIWLNDSTQVSIKGVLANFYDKGAARNINPLLLRDKQDGFNCINILVNEKNKTTALNQVAAVWKNLHSHTPFEYQWLDKKIAERDDQTGTYSILGFLALIVITIASLGLLGLVIYTVETRQKEISIRKVIGAQVSQLMYMLSKSFIKLIVIAGLIALPVAFILSVMFLQNFPTRITIGPGILLSGFLFLFLIGLITILWNTYKASTINPVENLRME